MSRRALRVVVFSGGRGSEVLSQELLRHPDIALTLLINGYDDGASTGEVRRALGDCLGPSDFRKNASRLARELHTCPPELVALLDLRFPDGYDTADVGRLLGDLAPAEVTAPVPAEGFDAAALDIWRGLPADTRAAVHDRLVRFRADVDRRATSFAWGDCSVGNLVFAGGFLAGSRDFNAAVRDYCRLLGVPDGMILNVTDGANAFLVALDADGCLLGSEAAIVQGGTQRRIRDVYLLDRALDDAEVQRLNADTVETRERFLAGRERPVSANPLALAGLAEADLIISAPGTQHSSLFPSYVTPGVGQAIARNLTAIKLLVTNIQRDAELGGATAVDIVDRAVYYLREKGRQPFPVPALVTHFLMNDPARREGGTPYIPLGRLETLEDPRLVRIANFEAGVSGRHNAKAVLTPFIRSLVERAARPRVAVALLETSSTNLIAQTVLEMVRAGVSDVPVDLTVWYQASESLDPSFIGGLPFPVRNAGGADSVVLAEALRGTDAEYLILFDSSGMYRGDDVVNVATLLTSRRLDAIWGSRRLSVADIRASYRLRYRHNVILGAVSYVGSHALSLAYLLLYGRYVSDTLSGVRAVRARHALASGVDLGAPTANHQLLSVVLSERASLFETPVQFFPLSPDRVRRTNVLDGLRSLWTVLRWRGRRPSPTPHAGDAGDARDPRRVEAPRAT